MAPGQEVDRVTAQVVLGSGNRTQPMSVDLTRNPNYQGSAGPVRNNRGWDSTDGRGTNIRVATYVESNKMEILVRTMHGKNIAIRMSPNDTIGDLKTKISKETRISQCDYWLDFQEKPLDDNYTLKYYSLGNNCHVTMKGRLKGG